MVDVEKIRLLLDAKKFKHNDFSRQIGMGKSFMSNLLCGNESKGTVAGKTKLGYVKLIAMELGVNYEDLIIKEPVVEGTVEEPVVEEIKEEPVVVNIDMTETNELLKDLISAVNKLGNLEMQNMEYLKELRDLMK